MPAQHNVDLIQVLVALVALIVGAIAIVIPIGWLGIFTIVLVDLFVALLIHCAAIKSTPTPCGTPRVEPFPFLPTRKAALVLLPLLLFALVAAFGAVYLWSQGVGDSQTPQTLLADPWDALYFSTVTITTLGYGDFHPVGLGAKIAVIGELFSGILMLVGAFPLLVGRLTTW